ncbi:hypothetical protein A2690_04900 [Candidatus Roizmanbacteria bacterium RIFCSPHIGHO2_01_FULL_39_12b]|uniref:Aspartate racemase n=1 Tax=Candidatus Roizmanbacteria bacterium RIFCSPHIGHO2_01_FULL_39_12b TaxID=1802030 RepID=A0A1F7GCU1_9BACT|nr:MAG: hypothetical protein A2690_04900 [Candidatus Roizmanbacteria bacterium RIFCSPHIGHO2_01_FULL_39_12b]
MTKQINNHKKIGIIGGVGPQATAFIYQKIIELAQTKYLAENNDDFPNLIIESVPIPDFITDKSQIEEAKTMLIEATKALTAAGATKLCIGSNTVHILLEDLSKETDIEFISMITLVGKLCQSRNLKKVGLLGTPVLIESGMYVKELEKYGIETILPTEKQLEIADRIIRGVIAGEQNEEDKQAYIACLNEMFGKGAETIILACTELPLALNYEALGNRTINSDEVLAEGLVDYYYYSKN